MFHNVIGIASEFVSFYANVIQETLEVRLGLLLAIKSHLALT